MVVFTSLRLAATTLLLLGASVTAFPTTNATELSQLKSKYNPNCGGSPGSCGANNCQARNDPNGGLSTCAAGKYYTCQCKSTCGPTNGSCNDCGGWVQNAQEGSTRYMCWSGYYEGCYCNP